MKDSTPIVALFNRYINPGDHAGSDYFSLIKELVKRRQSPPDGTCREDWAEAIQEAYLLVEQEIINNRSRPVNPVVFGTSGWRGIIGKDFNLSSVTLVTRAILELYQNPSQSEELKKALGVADLNEARERGCVVGYDNRFGGEIFARAVIGVLTSQGFRVHYAGESTTGVLSAALLELNAAFSINLTPSHNPLEYAGFKYNAADAGPAARIITDNIADNLKRLRDGGRKSRAEVASGSVTPCDSLAAWKSLVRKGKARHGVDYESVIAEFHRNNKLVIAVDSIHGAGRIHLNSLLGDTGSDRLIALRSQADQTFGGIAPEPSSANLKGVLDALRDRAEPLKLGVIIDPDADRIRFTDGLKEIEMNQFGAAAYHYLHQEKGIPGPVAKSVATSNFANAIAKALGESVFESRVGFKEFKPVIGRAVVCFEESDGISIIGHTPEKDAYIGLILAMEMTMHLGMNLSEYIEELENKYGRFYPDRSAISVKARGAELAEALDALTKYSAGSKIQVGDEDRTIARVMDIDGRKMIFEDGSWLMIRASGTEPKVRFYIESRTDEGRSRLFSAAQALLAEIGIA